MDASGSDTASTGRGANTRISIATRSRSRTRSVFVTANARGIRVKLSSVVGDVREEPFRFWVTVQRGDSYLFLVVLFTLAL